MARCYGFYRMSPFEKPNVEQTENQMLTAFRGRRLPVPAHLAGYSELIDRYQLPVPLHHEMTAISSKNLRRKEDGWAILPIAVMPGPSDIDQLVFAIKYEGIQPLVLKKLFERIDPSSIERAARSKPTSTYLRRICHLYEWLTEKRLDVPDTSNGGYVDLVDTEKQYGVGVARNSRRFRIRDNLPGEVGFCPVVFRTHRLDAFIAKDLSRQAQMIVDNAPKDLIARAAAFLLLRDSKASFEIEGEDPPKDRLARWGFTISKAGKMKLAISTLVGLQRELIGDARFVRIGLRKDGGFVGRHDSMGQPVPDHVSAKPIDISPLLEALVAFDDAGRDRQFHPVLAAACVAFGFIYIHPFEDGNGRIHRFLMHHVLAEHGFTPEQIVFPVSSVILDMVARYKDVLESVSGPLLEWIDWRPTATGNVEVTNDTKDYYRFFDATAHCEFLFRCIETAVEKDLPEELQFLERRDAFHREVTGVVDMSERKLDLLLRFLKQGHGALSKRAKEHEFALLSDDEAERITAIYAAYF